jgi:hypothetical protein
VNSKRLLEELNTLLTTEQINTNADELYDAAADRYKKYAKARKALDVPSPVAIVYPKDTQQVSEVLRYCNENAVNVIARSGKTATEGGLENWKEQLTIVLDSSAPRSRSSRSTPTTARHRAGGRCAAAAGRRAAKGGLHHRAFSAEQARREDGRPRWRPAASVSSPRCMAASRTWLSVLSVCSRMVTSPASRTCRAEPAVPISAISHRQRRNALLHHGSDGEDLPVFPGK